MVWFIFLVLLHYISASENTNSGVELCIPISTFNTLSKDLVPFFEKQFSHMTFPEITEDVDTPIGKIEFTLKGMVVETLALSSPSFSVASASTVTMYIAAVSSSIHGDWEYKEKHGLHLKDHGSMDLSITASLKLVFGAKIEPSKPSGIVVEVTSVGVSFSHFDVKLHGGASWLYNLVISQLKSTIEHTIEKTVSAQIPAQVVPLIQKELDQFAVYPIGFEGLEASMVVERFDFANNGLIVGCKGEIIKPGVPEYQGVPPTLPSIFASSKMITAYASNYLPNSAMYVLTKIGLLKYVITQKTIPPSIPIQLNTSFFEFIIPELYQAYPNKAMQITIEANPSAPPTVLFTSGIIGISANLDTVFQVLDPDVIDAFTIDTFVQIGANISFVSNGTNFLISGEASLQKFNMTLTQSKIGKLDLTLLSTAVSTLLKDFGFPMLNTWLADHPFALPPIPDVKIQEPVLKVFENYVELDANFDIHLT